MFNKILIANRGEIACRVIKTARRMGVHTVAVFSEADRDALHVMLADEAICIGPPVSTQSYLSIEQIIEACKTVRCRSRTSGVRIPFGEGRIRQAIEEAGIVFIGPKPDAMISLGDKISSKKLAKQAGVNTVPGNSDVIRDADHAVGIARNLAIRSCSKPVPAAAARGCVWRKMTMSAAKDICGPPAKQARHLATSGCSSRNTSTSRGILRFKFWPTAMETSLLGERECSLAAAASKGNRGGAVAIYSCRRCGRPWVSRRWRSRGLSITSLQAR